jgi:signal transduction histidine kinase
VRVTLSGQQGGVRVQVMDTGPGISLEDLPHVFERFYRADKSRTRATGGAGLGLAIARQIVELHGGSLDVKSVPGKGTTFTFALGAAS